jgi:hypothetical protein
MTRTLPYLAILLSCLVSLVRAESKPEYRLYQRPSGLVPGGAFIDLIQPIPVADGLESNTWGRDGVKPRVVKNWIPAEKRGTALEVGPPCETTISGGRSFAGARCSGFTGR